MKYLVSFRTALRVSRYLFRGLALVIWLVGILISLFTITESLHEKENRLREQLFTSFSQTQFHVTHLSEASRGLKYVAENQLNRPPAQDDEPKESSLDNPILAASAAAFFSLSAGAECQEQKGAWQSAFITLSHYLHLLDSQYASTYEISNIYLLDRKSSCAANFMFNESSLGQDGSRLLLRDHQFVFQTANDDTLRNPLYWLASGNARATGSLFMSMPIYSGNQRTAEVVVEQNLRLDDTLTIGNIPIDTMVTDRSNRILLANNSWALQPVVSLLPSSKQWFGYIDNYRYLALKNSLTPGPFNMVYLVSTTILFDQMRLMLLNTLLLNLFTALFLICLTLMFEKRMFIPAFNNALRLEEHEQFNRKIVASAPVGICILRTSDGSNILSNELAHNYLSVLTPEDRVRIGEIIRGQEVNFMDVLTASKINLQMSFVHSRYRNEDVAICVFIDVSARVMMEKSLQEIANSAEQASQSKSMFLATVSHELRTPLYGIIGNLDLLQTRELPDNILSLVQGMNNSSSLLLKIINDILDFSKIESEQLKISPVIFSPSEVISHVEMNYLPLVIRKRLTLWCFIEADVPLTMLGDPIRLQQVISNLLSNAIKFTHTGGILLHLWCEQGYLHIRIRDTGIGIRQRDVLQLFDPFFQVEGKVQRNFQGTGLGLAICEKLINMMDGDITVCSEPDIGSEFTLRLPVWQGQRYAPSTELSDKSVVVLISNRYFSEYMIRRLQALQIVVSTTLPEKEDPMRVVITDDASTYHDGRTDGVWVLFSPWHNDKPTLMPEGYWLMTTAKAYELPELLTKIWQSARVNIKSDGVTVAPIEERHEQRILVVDDHPINRLLLSEQLTTLGYRTRTAKDGLDALEVLKVGEIDIVLTDINMPNLDGYGLARQLRREGKSYPIIGLTANALVKEQQLCLDAGMNDCLSKPITLEELQRALQTYLSMKEN
ncbi:two-component system sensor histidine kinase RcsC [Rosenbergiella australiborealis]|uniref:two-component system sensor histidine kinase RcsC n=1 Tax=Rosenbergiella australiborealis TaxID=1544696 RepID=UPI001F4DDA1D